MTGPVTLAHAVVAGALALLFLGAAVWGIRESRTGASLSRRYDRLLWLLQALLFAQIVTGVALLVRGRPTDHALHILIGSAAALAPWGAWLLVKRGARVSLKMAGACVLGFVLVLLAVFTAFG